MRPWGWVIVRQIRPGVRLRAVVDLDTEAPGEDEANVRRLWGQVERHPGARPIILQVEELGR